MKASEKLLQSRGWAPSPGGRMQMGRDAKWQLNVMTAMELGLS